MALKYIENPTELNKITALKSTDGLAIYFIENQNDYLQYVTDPYWYEEVINPPEQFTLDILKRRSQVYIKNPTEQMIEILACNCSYFLNQYIDILPTEKLLWFILLNGNYDQINIYDKNLDEHMIDFIFETQHIEECIKKYTNPHRLMLNQNKTKFSHIYHNYLRNYDDFITKPNQQYLQQFNEIRKQYIGV